MKHRICLFLFIFLISFEYTASASSNDSCKKTLEPSSQAPIASHGHKFNSDVNAKEPHLILGVQKNADEDTLKAAYREAILRYHPDRKQLGSGSQAMQAVTEAYTRLVENLKWRNPSEESPFDGGFYGLDQKGVARVYANPFEHGPVIVRRTAYKLFGIKGTFFLDWNKGGEPSTPDYARVVSAVQDIEASPEVLEELDALLALFAWQHQVGLQWAFEMTVGVINGQLEDHRDTPNSYAAAKIFVSHYFGLYVQNIADPANDHAFQKTVDRLKKWDLLPEMSSNVIMPSILNRPANIYDPRAFYQLLVHHLLQIAGQKNFRSELQNILKEAASIHSQKFGGEEIHFLTFLLAFHNIQLTGQKLSHETPAQRAVIQGVVDLIKLRLAPELLSKKRTAPLLKEGQSKDLIFEGTEKLDRFMSFFMILTLLEVKVPIYAVLHNNIVPIEKRNSLSIPRKELFHLFKMVPGLDVYIRNKIPEYSAAIDEFAHRNFKKRNNYDVTWLFTWNGK